MDRFVNLGQIQSGRLPDGWRKSLLSPFGKVISEEEWDMEGWTDSDLKFNQQTPERQQAIKADFVQFFEELGDDFIVLEMAEPLPTSEDQEYFEPLMEPFVRQEGSRPSMI